MGVHRTIAIETVPDCHNCSKELIIYSKCHEPNDDEKWGKRYWVGRCEKCGVVEYYDFDPVKRQVITE